MKKDLHLRWDEKKVCKNPNKGWYLHYYSNSLDRYGKGLEPGDFLEDFPGLNHIYMRLPWCLLEPEEGKYDWAVFDEVADKWVAHGYNVAFRVTCMETDRDYIYATPEWVRKAGAEGIFCPCYYGDWSNWEPDYGHRVFLEKLENFHMAFAAHYDGKPWVEYIDIGSYGNWGEGHTWFGSKKVWPFEVIKQHIDIYCRCYKNSFKVINDDYISDRRGDEESKSKLLEYFIEKGLAFRDDSICELPLRMPEVFDKFWTRVPVDLEVDHYGDLKPRPGWKGGEPLFGHVEVCHPTFIGFHGFPREWLPENRELANKLANRMGYWYFIKSIEMPDGVKRSKDALLKIEWMNRGVAPAYHTYKLKAKLQKKDGGVSWTKEFSDSGNRKWMPDVSCWETYTLQIPAELEPGCYELSITLVGDKGGREKSIELGLKDCIKDSEGFYNLAGVSIV